MGVINVARKNAIRFIVFLGCTSLFADMTYEGARSINGPFLKILGASGTTVGIVAGLGELVGYGLRLLSGYLSDRSHKYWTILLSGYVINLLSVPMLAYAGYWQAAVVLMIAERAGKAIRTPTRDAMLSHAAYETGRGWGFGLHEFMDQLGATIGPLLVSAVLVYQHDDFRNAYLVLLIPALCALSLLVAARKLFPRPQDLEIRTLDPGQTGQLATPSFIIYTLAAISLAMGYADYPLIAYHFKQQALVTDAWIPVLYSVAMLSEALTALWAGRLYDRIGPVVLLGITVLTMFFAPLVFLAKASWIVIGMILWGLGMGAQGSLLKAIVAGLVEPRKRATAFGIFDTFYGVAWFAGSAYMGYLYDRSLEGLVIFSMNMQLLAIIVLFLFIRYNRKKT
ncbi:MAG TPA: MFS transporter [Puia sp.]|nr:MFS transporter [Puia sp.]